MVSIPLTAIISFLLATLCGLIVGVVISVLFAWGNNSSFKYTLPSGVIIAWVLLATHYGYISWY
jgi:hypothetical protein